MIIRYIVAREWQDAVLASEAAAADDDDQDRGTSHTRFQLSMRL